MARWICPECGGGMPHTIRKDGIYSCPWCSCELAEWATERIASANLAERLER